MALSPCIGFTDPLACTGQWLANLWISVADEKGNNGCMCDDILKFMLPTLLEPASVIEVGLG